MECTSNEVHCIEDNGVSQQRGLVGALRALTAAAVFSACLASLLAASASIPALCSACILRARQQNGGERQ